MFGYISMYIGTHGYGPTYREISKATGLKSLSSVRYQLGELESKGFISHTWNISRGIALVNRDSQ